MHSDWYREFFAGPVVAFWQQVVPPQQTQAEIEWLLSVVRPPRGGRVLDIPCGCGRHAVALARLGFDVVGIDISEESLEIARAAAAAASVFVDFRHGEMSEFRDPRPFDLAICLGNSFGYLDHEQTVLYLQRMSTALLARGWLIIDTGAVAESLLPNFSRELQIDLPNLGLRVANEYDVADSRLLTQYTFVEPDGETVRHGSQAVYTTAEIGRMLCACGLAVRGRYGSTDSKPYEIGDRHLLIAAQKS